MLKPSIALFGEAERGQYRVPYIFSNVVDLWEQVGSAPPGSFGIHLGVQILLYRFPLLFFRVREEGFSMQDYFEGVWLLKTKFPPSQILAVGIPGVGNKELIDCMEGVCEKSHALLILRESDFYDYLSESAA